MTVTMKPNSNGNVQRKSLASQLDRLDSILDGLDQALTGAITEAVKEAVSTAVSEAVRATLIEVVTNPDVLALLRGGIAPVASVQVSASAAADSAAPRPTVVGRVRRFVSSSWKRALAKVRGVGAGVAQRIRSVRDGIKATYQGISAIWRLKRAVLIALGIGAAVGVVGYVASPWCAGVIGGIGAMGTALGAQLAFWTRRLFAGFAVH